MLYSTGLVKAYVAGYNGYLSTKCGEFLEQLHENDSVRLLSPSVNRAGTDWHIYALNTRREYILQVFFCVLFSNLFSVTNRKGYFSQIFISRTIISSVSPANCSRKRHLVSCVEYLERSIVQERRT